MIISRRTFVKSLALGGTAAMLAPSRVFSVGKSDLVILHTNDTHSRIDPFPEDGGRNAGLGGAARRAALIKRVRSENPNVLLLDSGDIFQGTPYFNLFKGEIEFKTMSAMKYDMATLGNHDFDNGVNGLVDMLPHAEFPFVCANYEVQAGSPLKPHLEPWNIIEAGPYRVGIFGLGIAFDGLVLSGLHHGVRYLDPLAAARESVEDLQRLNCDLIICLSHLGNRYDDGKVSDHVLAQSVSGINLILGGHTHTFMREPVSISRQDGWETRIHQVGFGGIRLGRIDVSFSISGNRPALQAASMVIDTTYDTV